MKKAITYEAPELMVFEIHTAGTLCQSQSYGDPGAAGLNGGYEEEKDGVY